MRIEYLAGLIDGDGCFSFKGRQPVIQITNTNPSVLRKVASTFGGPVFGPYAQRGFGRKPVYIWRISSQNATKRLAKRLIPHLIIKREKAEAMVQQVESYQEGRVYEGRRGRRPRR